ncbi:MAG TPA: Smr/MutS family protein [Chthonomonadaceae bacterium]|nr:Smr/MutS family protein [Chthonomonadaceae bacterium]
MANRRVKKDVDAEADLHGLTVEQMRLTLQKRWPEWRGRRRVRLIHGRGAALKPELERWCREMGIPYAQDQGNPGSLVIFPHHRALPDTPIATTLREKGLRLTPEEEAYLRDPAVVERARQEERQRQQEEARRRRAEEAAKAAQSRRDEALWQAEMARLDALDRRRGSAAREENKPSPPRILPPSQLKYQEGYWRAELIRVADTDTDTLKKQKRTGLDKLAPPLEVKPPQPPSSVGPATPPPPPERDTAADQALFEEEMARLAGFEPGAIRRVKRE